ncbi:hypothetical protein M9H77_35697 [Catharanthus roseus]|uniref:Uncharacterized protein n=1 Tax=Catharanthus roseus TaxID=4058 RepID=A0ACB9ZRX2_CATRO|nr:hypothetical protein M9H77_35697 [Catharanthus roseus]
MKESCCDISLPLNPLSSEEVNLFTSSNNHFLACFSQSVQKFEAQNMENVGILGYKLYKTISFLPSTSFFFVVRRLPKVSILSFSFQGIHAVPICGNKMGGSFKVLEVHLCDFKKTTFGNGVILENFIVQNTNSRVKLLNQHFGGTLHYSLTFDEFLDETLLFQES